MLLTIWVLIYFDQKLQIHPERVLVEGGHSLNNLSFMKQTRTRRIQALDLNRAATLLYLRLHIRVHAQVTRQKTTTGTSIQELLITADRTLHHRRLDVAVDPRGPSIGQYPVVHW